MATFSTTTPMLEDYVIVAVDATPLMLRGYSKLGVAPVLMDPSGLNLEYLDVVIGGNEEEVLGKVLDILSDKLRYRKVLFYVNRTSVPQDILDRYVGKFEELLVVAFSKRGIPRLLKLQSGGQEISVSLPEGGSFVKHEVTSSGSFNVYHYIGVTNTIERDDLTPITASIRVYTTRRLSGSEERALLGYIQSSTGIYVESPYNLPSPPQPLHEAHRLSRKLYKISRWGVIFEKLKPEVLGRVSPLTVFPLAGLGLGVRSFASPTPHGPRSSPTPWGSHLGRPDSSPPHRSADHQGAVPINPLLSEA
jgi:hypothetical protein